MDFLGGLFVVFVGTMLTAVLVTLMGLILTLIGYGLLVLLLGEDGADHTISRVREKVIAPRLAKWLE